MGERPRSEASKAWAVAQPIWICRPRPAPELVRAVEIFAGRYGEDQLWPRNALDIAESLNARRLVVLMTRQPAGQLELIGVGQSDLRQDGNVVEVTFTVVHPTFRGFDLAEVLGGAAMLNECMELSEVWAIITTMRPTNASCRRANQKAQAVVMSAYEAVTYWQLQETLKTKIALYRSRRWPGGPDTAVVMPETYNWALEMMAGAATQAGFALPSGMTVRLGCGWDDGDLRGLIERAVDLDPPRVSIWKDLVEPRHVA